MERLAKKAKWGWAAILVAALCLGPFQAAAQMYVEGTHFWFDPAVFPGSKAPKDHPRGPEKARGLVIWNDGYDPAVAAPLKTPPIVQYFAEAGWDAMNLRRHTAVMGDQTVNLILSGIEQAKAKGYQRILLFGQSRGAYASIQTGTYKPDILGILPLAPAGFGDYGRSNQWRQNHTAIRDLWESYKGSGIRVAAGFFTGDDWFETKEPGVRGPYATKRLTELGVANFIINEPAHPWMQGHGGGYTWQFARRFGPCLDHFFETGEQPACDDDDPRTPQIFGIKTLARPETNGPLSGLWQGTWQLSGRFAALAVEDNPQGRSGAVYSLGKGANGDVPEATWLPLLRQRDELVREANIEFRLSLLPDGRLKLRRIDKAKPDAPENAALLLRVRG